MDGIFHYSLAYLLSSFNFELSTYTGAILKQVVIILLLSISGAAFAAEQVSSAREARHLLTPFIGYQILNGEEVGANFTLTQTSPFFPDTVFSWSQLMTGERSAKAPALGFAYRYFANPIIGFEATAGVIHDQTTLNYPAALDVFGFTQRWDVNVMRQNTAFLTAGGFYLLPKLRNWLDISLKASIGYAQRSITTNRGGTTIASGTVTTTTFDFDDTEKMLSWSAGADFTLWRGDLLLLRGGLMWTQYSPIGADVSKFGGLGWQINLFPFWSGR